MRCRILRTFPIATSLALSFPLHSLAAQASDVGGDDATKRMLVERSATIARQVEGLPHGLSGEGLFHDTKSGTTWKLDCEPKIGCTVK